VKRETMRKRVLAILSKLRQDFKNKENEWYTQEETAHRKWV
jgi:hypothetical protein